MSGSPYSLFRRLPDTLTLLAALGLPLFAQANWPEFQGPNQNGVLPDAELNLKWGEDGPPILWTKELNEGFGGAAVAGDEVFLMDRALAETDILLCLDKFTGDEKWSYTFTHAGRLPHAGSRGVPTVEEDAVYLIGGFGHVTRINRETHKADWTVAIQEKYEVMPPKWGYAQSPLVVGDTLIIAPMSEQVGLAGLDKTTGEEIWRTEPFGDSHSTPALLDLGGVEQVVFLATLKADQKGTTISVDPSTGEVLWKTDVYFNSIPITRPMQIDDKRVFLTGGYDCGSCMIQVERKDGDWRVEKLFDMVQGTQMHPPMLVGEHLYFLANENSNHKGEDRKKGGLLCMELDGTILWNTGDAPFMGRGNMIQAGNVFLIQDGETGYLRVVEPSPKGYKQLAEADIFGKRAEVDAQIESQKGRSTVKMPDFKYWSPMALSNGLLFMRGQEQFKCVDLRP